MRSSSKGVPTDIRNDSTQPTQSNGTGMETAQPRHASDYRDLPLSQLQESLTNPRKRFDENSLNELAASFKTQGVLAPLVVRRLPNPNTEAEGATSESSAEQYEVVAGARRFRAARIAELETVPVRVVELSHAAAIETQVVENLQREDIHPLEEAIGFRSLLEVEGAKYTVAEIAAKCGKGEPYIVNRIRLTELVPPVAEAFLADRITIGHALLIAKLPASRQQEAFGACFRQMWMSDGNQQVLIPAKELSAWIQSNIMLELSAAPFDRNDTTLVPGVGGCADCPKRTGFNVMLFAEFAGHKDCCTDAECFGKKADAHIAKAVESKPKLVQISSAWASREGAPLGRNCYAEIEPERSPRNGKAKEPNFAQKPCRSMTEAIYMDGGRRGKIVKICADFNCRVHHADKQQPSPEQVERQRTAERKRIEAQKVEITTRHQILAAVLAKANSPLGQQELQLVAWRLVEKLDHQRRILLAKRHKLLCGRNSDAEIQAVEKALRSFVKESNDAALCRLLLECVLLDAAYQAGAPTENDSLLRIARRYRIDVEQIGRAVKDSLTAKVRISDTKKPDKNAIKKAANKSA